MITFEEKEKLKPEIIKKIDNNVFLTGLFKLTKKEMYVLIVEILFRIDFEYENFERDFKDNVYDKKCWLIDTLDPEYFSKQKYKGEKK